MWGGQVSVRALALARSRCGLLLAVLGDGESHAEGGLGWT